MTMPTGEPHAGPATVQFSRGRELAHLRADRDRAVAHAATVEQDTLTRLVEDLAPLGVFDPASLPQTLGGATATIEAYVRSLREQAIRGEEIARRRDELTDELAEWLMSPVGV